MKYGVWVMAVTCSLALTLAEVPEVRAQDGFETYDGLQQGSSLISSVRQSKPAASTPDAVALIFYKLSNILPDFATMARAAPEYEQAYGGEKISIFNQRSEALKNAYSLLTLQEPVLVEVPVTLSEYSTRNQGFFIADFETSTFFPFESHGKRFAVVPEGIMDWQWLKVTDAKTAGVIERVSAAAKAGTGSPATALVYLAPSYTDSTNPAQIAGNEYWLISAEVVKLELYLPGTSVPVWSSSDVSVSDENSRLQELIQLRQ